MKRIIILWIVIICIAGFSETEKLKKEKEYFQNNSFKEAEWYLRIGVERESEVLEGTIEELENSIKTTEGRKVTE